MTFKLKAILSFIFCKNFTFSGFPFFHLQETGKRMFRLFSVSPRFYILHLKACLQEPLRLTTLFHLLPENKLRWVIEHRRKLTCTGRTDMDAGCTGHAARLIRDVRLGRVNGLNRTDHSATTAAKTTRIRLGLQRQRRNFPVRALTGNRGNHRVRGIQPLFKQR